MCTPGQQQAAVLACCAPQRHYATSLQDNATSVTAAATLYQQAIQNDWGGTEHDRQGRHNNGACWVSPRSRQKQQTCVTTRRCSNNKTDRRAELVAAPCRWSCTQRNMHTNFDRDTQHCTAEETQSSWKMASTRSPSTTTSPAASQTSTCVQVCMCAVLDATCPYDNSLVQASPKPNLFTVKSTTWQLCACSSTHKAQYIMTCFVLGRPVQCMRSLVHAVSATHH